MKYRLYLFTDGFPYGNGESFIENEIEYLTEKFDVTVFATTNRLQSVRVYENLSVVRFEKPEVKQKDMLASFTHLLMNRYGRAELKEICKYGKNMGTLVKQSCRAYAMGEKLYSYFSDKVYDGQPAVFYFYWNTYKCVPFLMNRNNFPESVMVSRIHGYDLYNERNKLGRQPFKTLNQKLDRLFFLSEAARAYYKRTFDSTIEQYSAIAGLGTKQDRTSCACGYSENRLFRLCSCSRVVPLKRIELIIDALSLISDYKIEWTHFGDGENFERIRTIAHERLSDHANISVAFAGAVPNSELKKRYAQAPFDCYILTSESEGVPVSIMEALSFGFPVIATSVGGIPDMLKNSSNILLPEKPTAEDVKCALEKICGLSEEDRRKLREDNTVLWKTKYSAETNYKEFTDCLQKMMDKRAYQGGCVF